MHTTTHSEGSSATIAVLLVQLIVGYEWLVSGLTKIVHGDFPSGLAGALTEMAKGSSGWYGSFLTGIIEPHASPFAYAIEWGELATGLVLLVAAATSLYRGSRQGDQAPRWLARASAAAIVAGLILAVNFELATGGTFGLRLAPDSFDEGVDLDTLMLALQLALLVPAVRRALGAPKGASEALRLGPFDASLPDRPGQEGQARA